jgi:hypothetical protein
VILFLVLNLGLEVLDRVADFNLKKKGLSDEIDSRGFLEG